MKRVVLFEKKVYPKVYTLNVVDACFRLELRVFFFALVSLLT